MTTKDDIGLWRQARSLFDDALARAPEDRRRWVRERCGRDPDLQRRVEQLLATDERLEGLTAALAAGTATALGEVCTERDREEAFGPYRLVRPIGEGGMGTVYLAERADDRFDRRVAIKILRAGISGDERVARFERERQILAQLEHPWIARLYDAGTTASGRPFVVMELVEGRPITEHCRASALGLRARLEIFLRVCRAVQHAHESLVVHRDLKPSNVLVDADGEPKLLDFGIAKLLGEPEETATLERVMTPAYASPEQVVGRPVTAATDVYSLGVILYELLCDRLPHELAGLSPRQVEERLLDTAPPAPSARLLATSDRPSSERRRRARALEGDLDVITQKALAADARHRYRAVHLLAGDLQRHLDGRPILARPHSVAYRLGKLLRRRRQAVGLVAALAVSILALTAVTLIKNRQLARERNRAVAGERQALTEKRRAESVAAFLTRTFQVADPYRSHGAEASLEEVLDQAARSFDVALDEAPDLEAYFAATLGEVFINLGRADRARPLLESAQAGSGGDAGLAARLHRLRSLVAAEAREFEAAEREALAAVEAARRQADPIELADALLAAARSQLHLDRTEAAVAAYDEAIGFVEAALPEDRERLATALLGRADAAAGAGDDERADALYRRAVETLQPLAGGRHPLLAAAVQRRGVFLRRRERHDEAFLALGEALELNEEIYGDESLPVANAANSLANYHRRLDQPQEALALYRRTLAIYAEHLPPDSARLGTVSANLGGLLHLHFGELAEAEELLRRAVAIAEARYGDGHLQLAIHRSSLAMALGDRGKLGEAEALLRRSVEVFRGASRVPGWAVARLECELGGVELRRGEGAAGGALVAAALPVLEEEFGGDDLSVRRCRRYAALGGSTNHSGRS